MAITLISHTGSRIERKNLDLFVTVFQSVSPLSIKELWAIPGTLVERVGRMALRTV